MKKFIPMTLMGVTALFAAVTMAETQTLRGADVAIADQAPAERTQLGGKPGAQKGIARTFEQQPPLIPHMTANFDEITLEENQCLSCHDVTRYKEKNAPKIGVSHMKDSSGKVQKTVSSARWNCISCHIPQTDAPPLVDNTFKSVPFKLAPVKAR